jgi:hypothetical protein
LHKVLIAVCGENERVKLAILVGGEFRLANAPPIEVLDEKAASFVVA